jgi:alcohol dehydrogenase, propanol-preferring
VVNSAEVDPVTALAELGGVDVALVLAAAPIIFEQAFASLRRGGRLSCVALPAEAFMRIPVFDLVLKGISVIDSIIGTRQDLMEVFELHASGRTEVIAETRKLNDANEATGPGGYEASSPRTPPALIIRSGQGRGRLAGTAGIPRWCRWHR